MTGRARAGSRLLLVALALALAVACYSAAVAASPWINLASTDRGPSAEASAAAVRAQASDVGPGSPLAEVTALEQWVIASNDNGNMPFLIIDKVNATVFVFNAAGQRQAAAPALLGLTRGDSETKGVSREGVLATRPQERITPAGRFVASLGSEPSGKGLLWVDYKDAIALHPVVKGTPQEHRAERLASPTSADNRISYGCINVPLQFYEQFVRPAFTHSSGIVYILPETSSGRRSFWSDKTEHGASLPVPAQP